VTEKNGENVRLVFLQDYLLMSAWLSPTLRHVVLLLLGVAADGGGGVACVPAKLGLAKIDRIYQEKNISYMGKIRSSSYHGISGLNYPDTN
jgi:hypothetical protein